VDGQAAVWIASNTCRDRDGPTSCSLSTRTKRSGPGCLPGSQSEPAFNPTICDAGGLPNRPLERTGFAGRSLAAFGEFEVISEETWTGP